MASTKSAAEPPSVSPWEEFLVRPTVGPEPEDEEKKEAPQQAVEKASWEEVIETWRSMSPGEIAEKLSEVEARHTEERQESFRQVGKLLSDPQIESLGDRMEKYAYANRPGLVQAITDAVEMSIEEASLEPQHYREARSALAKWKEGLSRLEDRYFACQNSRDVANELQDNLTKYGREVNGHLASVILPQKDIIAAVEKQFTKRYAPTNLMGTSRIFKEISEGNEFKDLEDPDGPPPHLYAAIAEGARCAHNMMHPAGLLSGVFLPAELRAKDLNETEKLYVKADLMALVAVRSAIGGFSNVADEALHKYGLRPRRIPKKRVSSNAPIFSGQNGDDNRENNDDDEMFYDVLESDDDDFFFDVEDAPEDQEGEEDDSQPQKPILSEDDSQNAFMLLRGIHERKQKIGGLRTVMNDPLTAFIMGENTDVAGLVGASSPGKDPEENEKARKRYVDSLLESAHESVDRSMLSVAYKDENHNDYVRDLMHRSVDLTLRAGFLELSDGVREEDRGEVRESISTYLASHALGRVKIVRESIAEAFRVPSYDFGENPEESPISPTSGVREGLRRRGSAPPPLDARTLEPVSEKNTSTYAEWATGISGAKFLSFTEIMANLIGFVAPTMAVAGVLGLVAKVGYGVTQSTTSALAMGAAVTIAQKSNEYHINAYADWARNMQTAANKISETAKTGRSKLTGLIKEKNAKLSDVQQDMVSLVEQVDGYQQIVGNLMKDNVSRLLTALNLRGAGLNYDRFVEYISNRELPSDIPLNAGEQTAPYILKGTCDLANTIFDRITFRTEQILQERGGLTDLPQGVDFLDQVLTNADVMQLRNMFGACSDTETAGQYEAILTDRLSQQDVMFSSIDQIMRLQQEEVLSIDQAKKLRADLIGTPVSRQDEGLTEEELIKNTRTQYEDGSTDMSTLLVSLSGNTNKLMRRVEALKKEFEDIEDSDADKRTLERWEEQIRSLDRQISVSAESNQRFHFKKLLGFVEELQYVRVSLGPEETRTLYENARKEGKLDSVFADGRSPISAFDREESDAHLRTIVQETANENLTSSTYNNDQMFNATSTVNEMDYGPVKNILNGVMGIFSASDAGTEDMSELASRAQQVIDSETGETLGADAVSNAKMMAEKIPRVFELPIASSTLSDGRTYFFPKVADISEIPKEELQQFYKDYVQVVKFLSYASEGDLSDENAKISRSTMDLFDREEKSQGLKLIQELGYYKTLFSSATRVIEALAVMLGGPLTKFAKWLLSFVASKENTWIQQMDEDLINIEELEREIGGQYMDRIGLTKKSQERVIGKGKGYIAKLVRVSANLRDSEWAKAATELFVDIPEQIERETGEPADEEGSIMMWLKENTEMVTTTVGMSTIAALVLMYSPNELSSVPAFNYAYQALTIGQGTILQYASTFAESVITFSPSLSGLVSGIYDFGSTTAQAGGPFLALKLLRMFADAFPESKQFFRGGIRFLGWVSRYIWSKITNLDTLFLAASFIHHYQQGYSDSVYFGAMMLFKLSGNYAINALVGFGFDSYLHVYTRRPSFLKLQRELQQVFLDATNKYFKVRLNEATISGELVSRFLRAKNETDVAAIVENNGIIKNFLPDRESPVPENFQYDALHRNLLRVIKNHSEAFLKQAQSVAKWRAVIVGLTNFGFLILSERFFDYMQKESFEFHAKVFKDGLQAMISSTLGTAGNAAAEQIRMVTDLSEVVDATKIAEFTRISNITDFQDALRDITKLLMDFSRKTIA